MNKILKVMLVSVLALTVLTGCGKKVEPFENSPDISMNIPHMEDFIDFENNTLIERYQLGYVKKMYNGDTTEFDRYEPILNEKFSPEEFTRWQGITEDFDWFIGNISGKMIPELISEFQVTALEYLRYTRMNEDNETVLSEEMKALNIREKTQEYMKENNIVVKDIIMAETPEYMFDRVYPFMFQFQYTVIGTLDGEEFEKDFTSRFYISANREYNAVMEYVTEGISLDETEK